MVHIDEDTRHRNGPRTSDDTLGMLAIGLLAIMIAVSGAIVTFG